MCEKNNVSNNVHNYLQTEGRKERMDVILILFITYFEVETKQC